MSNLFKKAIFFTDLHLGLKNNSEQHNTDCLDFVKWMIDTGKENGAETCFFLGDFHHNRSSINLKTLDYSLQVLELLNDNFEKTYILAGNHDLFFRDRRDVNGVGWAKHLDNIEIVNDWFKKDNVAIVPWLIGNDYKKVKKIKATYMFGHFELPRFKLNCLTEMPDTGEMSMDYLGNVGHVYSGHFHMRQERENVTYIGNCFPHDFSDAGDDKRGAMILEWGHKHEFISWPKQPLYKNVNLSDLLDNAEKILKPRMSVRVNLDIDISYEESNFIRETFIDTYNLRDISLIPIKVKEYEEDNSEAISFNSIDTIIGEQITNIESDFYKPELLMEIYREL